MLEEFILPNTCPLEESCVVAVLKTKVQNWGREVSVPSLQADGGGLYVSDNLHSPFAIRVLVDL